jgi:hypothetical protein
VIGQIFSKDLIRLTLSWVSFSRKCLMQACN